MLVLSTPLYYGFCDQAILGAVESNGRDLARAALGLAAKGILNETSGKPFTATDLSIDYPSLKDRRNAQETGQFEWPPISPPTLPLPVLAASALWVPGVSQFGRMAIYPTWLLAGAVILSVGLAGWGVLKQGGLHLLIPVCLLWAAATTALVVFHADSWDVIRHNIMNATVAHVALIFSLVFGMDEALSGDQREPESN
jgi:hypothetical protein